jgi:hypothetical protein
MWRNRGVPDTVAKPSHGTIGAGSTPLRFILTREGLFMQGEFAKPCRYGTASRQFDSSESRVSLRPRTLLSQFRIADYAAVCVKGISRGRMPSTWLGSPVNAALGCLRLFDASMTQPRAGNVGNAHRMRETSVRPGRAREIAPSVPYRSYGNWGFTRALPSCSAGRVCLE